MNIMLSGGTGFIGSHLIKALRSKGISIGVLKRNISDEYTDDSTATYYPANSYDEISSAFDSFNPDIVVHLATLYINNHTPAEINDLIDSNVTFGTMLLEAMSQKSVKYFLNIGTRWQHIDNQQYKAANLYAATKEAFLKILQYYASMGNILYSTLELSDTFGPGDRRKKIVSLLIDAAKNRKKIELSPGDQVIDLIPVEYVVLSIIYIIENKEKYFANDTYSLSGTTIKLKDLGSLIEKSMNSSGYFLWGAKTYRKNEVMEPPHYYPTLNVPGSIDVCEYIKRLCGDSL